MDTSNKSINLELVVQPLKLHRLGQSDFVERVTPNNYLYLEKFEHEILGRTNNYSTGMNAIV